RRDKQMSRLASVLAAQAARRFKAQQRSQAVTEKNKGFVQVGQQLLRYDSTERRHSFDMRFSEPVAATRQLNRPHFHARRQTPRPTMKDLRASARIMKAEQAQLSRRIRPRENNPFVRRLADHTSFLRGSAPACATDSHISFKGSFDHPFSLGYLKA